LYGYEKKNPPQYFKKNYKLSFFYGGIMQKLLVWAPPDRQEAGEAQKGVIGF
jgi:hypothetical protein